jgi:hypothetical protein
VYGISNANTVSNNVFVTSNTIVVDTEANATFDSGNTTFQVNGSFLVNADYISLDSATSLRFADANNDVALQTLITWIQRAWYEANSAHAAANTAGSVANAATVRLDSPTYGTSNGFTAIVGI